MIWRARSSPSIPMVKVRTRRALQLFRSSRCRGEVITRMQHGGATHVRCYLPMSNGTVGGLEVGRS
jgi:hypothetical protein